MNRIAVVGGSCLTGLLLLGVGHLYIEELSGVPETPPPLRSAALPSVKSEPAKPVPTPEERVRLYLSRLADAPEPDRLELASGLVAELSGVDYAGVQFPKELRLSIRRTVFAVIDSGSETQRAAAVSLLGRRSGLAGEAVYAKVLELKDQGLIGQDVLPSVLQRTGGEQAIPVIVELMKSTSDWNLINKCATALQDTGKPAVLGEVLARLEAIGSLESGAKLPWIARPLFGEFMKTAEGQDFSRGLTLARSKPVLVADALEAVERGLGHAEAAYRRLAAEAVERAVVAKRLEARTGEKLLAGRLEVETEPVLKAELTGGLANVRDQLQTTEQPALAEQ